MLIFASGVSEEEWGELGAENIFEDIIAGNFPNLGKETDIYLGSTENSKQRYIWSTPRHFVFKIAKINIENIK